jgi:transcriptional regulator with XRE-family HTH domain
MAHPQNIIGPQVKELRKQQGLTQAMLAARCGVLGWEISENGITKIEAQIRCITDQELVTLALALKVKLRCFFPDKEQLF